jgi:hypothetical protein
MDWSKTSLRRATKGDAFSRVPEAEDAGSKGNVFEPFAIAARSCKWTLFVVSSIDESIRIWTWRTAVEPGSRGS